MTADTRMMGIVHDALRRDLDRALTALTTSPYPDATQRAAIGSHVAWMMGFLHVHHHGEDEGLWPLVRERDPAAAPLIDDMSFDHGRLVPLIDVCAAAAQQYRRASSDDARVALLEALQRLSDALLAHLQREEGEMMPVAGEALTDAEWHAVDQKYFVKPKSFTELGFEGHWLLDELDAPRAEIVVHQVPPIPRFLLVHGFKRRYSRHVARCWRRTAPARAVQRSGRVETIVDAPIDDVWQVVSDVTRTGEWSHECGRVEWLAGATRAAPGVRFRGTNKAGRWKWSRLNEIVAVDAPRTLAWRTISTPLFPDSTEWLIELESVEDGTRIAQSFEVVRGSAVLGRIYGLLVPAHRNRDDGLTGDLRRIGEVARTRRGVAVR